MVFDCCRTGKQKIVENLAEQQQLRKHIRLQAKAKPLMYWPVQIAIVN